MPVTSQTTSQQFAAAFAAASAGIAPAKVPELSAAALLARHKRTLQTYAAKGYSAEQITDILKHPSIGIHLGVKTVRAALAAKAKKKKAPINYTAVLPNGEVITSEDAAAEQAQGRK